VDERTKSAPVPGVAAVSLIRWSPWQPRNHVRRTRDAPPRVTPGTVAYAIWSEARPALRIEFR